MSVLLFFFLMIRRPPRSTPLYSSAASDVYKRQGYKLYGDVEAGAPTQEKPGFTDQTESGKAQRRVRYCTIDNQNLCEIIWGDNRGESTYGVQIRSSVRQTKQIPYTQTNSTAPTLQMVELFYTEHGLPIDKDKTYDYANRYQIAYLPANFDGNNYEDRPNDRSIKPVSYTHLRAHETGRNLVCRLLLEKKKKKHNKKKKK